MSYRIPVGFTDHMRDEIEKYRIQHGASFAGAVAALVARGLAEVDREKAALATRNAPPASRQAFDETLPIPKPRLGLINDQPAPRLCHRQISERRTSTGTELYVCNRYDGHKGRCSRFGEKR